MDHDEDERIDVKEVDHCDAKDSEHNDLIIDEQEHHGSSSPQVQRMTPPESPRLMNGFASRPGEKEEGHGKRMEPQDLTQDLSTAADNLEHGIKGENEISVTE